MSVASSNWSKRRILASLLVLIACLIGAVVLWRRHTPDVPALEPQPLALGQHIYILGDLAPSAAYAIDTSSGLVLVDAGLKPDAARLKSQFRRLGLDVNKLRAILLTHVHGDHTGGAESLRRMTGAKIYIGSGDAAVLRSGGPREAFFSIFSMPDDEPQPTTVNVELKGDEVLDFGDVRIRAIATPGHTPGSTCYLMERGGFTALFAGDVISELVGTADVHMPGRNPLGTYSAYLPPRYRGDAREYLESLRKLRSMPAPDILLPGHPRSDPSPQSPQLTKERWAAILDRGIAELETLVSFYKSDGARFLDDTPEKLLPDLYYFGKFQGVAVYGFLAGSRFFLVNAPGGSGLGSFVKSGLIRLGLGAVRPFGVLLTSSDQEVTAGLRDLVSMFQTRGRRAIGGTTGCARGMPFRDRGARLGGVAGQELVRRDTAAPGRVGKLALPPIPCPGTERPFSSPGGFPRSWIPSPRGPCSCNLTRSRARTMEYLISIRRVAAAKPSLWLPAVPKDIQNAKIYASEWDDLIDKNYQAAAMILRGFP